jgi:hypothetical protein
MVTQAVCAHTGNFDIRERSVLCLMHGFALEQAILIFCHNGQIMELILEVYPDAIIVPVKSEVCAVCQASTMVCSLNARSGPFQPWANRSNGFKEMCARGVTICCGYIPISPTTTIPRVIVRAEFAADS